MCTAPPEARWPNEGFQVSSGNKRIGYDDLTLPQWAAGQLTNMLQIKDTTLMKQALLQVVLSLCDASSLPWPVVRGYGPCQCMKLRMVVWVGMTQPSGP